ncbi:cystatin [Blastocystis sp. subtype 4]|uniref:cystatin n=1 Tax=Blastocystis sp. subtype 4 TaxID=944170 RepID=UPI000711E28B|nr:cystatin [Blastocystis sp. subtype 4]KNB45300.1 cystatin [Blastocystis sp. subtype 4]|eukprot:XP_014528743.1 cystatin [Blastocystis sp. subtype 4]
MITVTVILPLIVMCGVVASTLCGGISSTTVDSHIEKMVADFKGEVESRLNEQFTTFKPVEATHQVVAGMNYRVKVDIGDNKAIFLQFYDRFGDVSLTSVETGKTLQDSLLPY